jgi:cytidine deaminase
VLGCNVENASYGMWVCYYDCKKCKAELLCIGGTICAERTALVKAVVGTNTYLYCYASPADNPHRVMDTSHLQL